MAYMISIFVGKDHANAKKDHDWIVIWDAREGLLLAVQAGLVRWDATWSRYESVMRLDDVLAQNLIGFFKSIGVTVQ